VLKLVATCMVWLLLLRRLVLLLLVLLLLYTGAAAVGGPAAAVHRGHCWLWLQASLNGILGCKLAQLLVLFTLLHSMTQHRSAQVSTAQGIAAQHSTAQGNLLTCIAQTRSWVLHVRQELLLLPVKVQTAVALHDCDIAASTLAPGKCSPSR
jgi:hypothetical protein